MSQPRSALLHAPKVADLPWDRLRQEARAAAASEPVLATLFHAAVLDQDDFEAAATQRALSRIAHAELPAVLLRLAFAEALACDAGIAPAIRADLSAVVERDPAAGRSLDAFLHFKGFHALVLHRLAHWLWRRGRQDLALYLQCRVSQVLQVDIHPAAHLGRGLFLDHATGIVVGETAVIDDDVSILQGVTLGGSGLAAQVRHPHIGPGVLIGAGARLFGPIAIGAGARIGAGALVLEDVPPHMTAAGSPARIIGPAGSPEPARVMDQVF